MTENTLIEQKAKIYSKEFTRAFIRCKNNYYYTGYITAVKEDFFVIEDKITGKTPILFVEVDKLEPYKDKAKEEKDEDTNK